MHRGLHYPVRMAGSSGTNTSSGTAQDSMDQDVVNIASPSPKADPAAAATHPSAISNGHEATSAVNGDKTSEVVENGHSENGSDAVTEEAVDVFPSLPDTQLVQMGLLPFTDQPVSEVLTEQDIENRYTALSIAFKTDKLTLRHRLDLQHRQRDQAERNMQAEVQRLKAAVQKLNRLCVDSDSADILTQIQSQVHVLQQSTDRVSNSAEMFGAVQQEQRLSKAVEVMLAHVDNLKRVYEKEHSELEETKRVLTENNIVMGDSSETDDVVTRGRHRSFQTLMGSNKNVPQSGAKRRASIATLPRSSGSSESIRSSTSSIYLQDIKNRFVTSNLRRRPSLNPAQPPAVNETPPTKWDSSDRLDKTDSLNGMDEIEELSESRRESAAMTQELNNINISAEENGSAFMSTSSSIITNGNGIPGNPQQEFQDLVDFSLESEHENDEEDEDEKDDRLAPVVEPVYHPLDCVWDCFSLLFNWVTDLLDPYLPLDGAYILQTVRRGVATTLLIAAAWCVCSTLIPSTSAHASHCATAYQFPVSTTNNAATANHPT